MHGGSITHQAHIVATTAGLECGLSWEWVSSGNEKIAGNWGRGCLPVTASPVTALFSLSTLHKAGNTGDPVGYQLCGDKMFPMKGMSWLDLILLPSVLWVYMDFEAGLSLYNESSMCESFTWNKSNHSISLSWLENSVFCIYLCPVEVTGDLSSKWEKLTNFMEDQSDFLSLLWYICTSLYIFKILDQKQNIWICIKYC